MKKAVNVVCRTLKGVGKDVSAADCESTLKRKYREAKKASMDIGVQHNEGIRFCDVKDYFASQNRYVVMC